MKRRRNPFGLDLGTVATLGAVIFLAAKFSPKNVAEQVVKLVAGAIGFRQTEVFITNVHYDAWLRSGSNLHVDFIVRHRGGPASYLAGAFFTSLGGKGDPNNLIWDINTAVSMGNDENWTDYPVNLNRPLAFGLGTYPMTVYLRQGADFIYTRPAGSASVTVL